MILLNGKTHRIEDGVPGVPRMYHLDIHRACDRFLASRGLTQSSGSRRNSWLFGRKKRRSS
jgi:hypothetical protein